LIQRNDISEQQKIVWTPIAEFTRNTRNVNVRFKVLNKGKKRIVTQRNTGRRHEISDCIVGDPSGIINLTLWNEDIDEIEQGYTYELQHGYINSYDECMILSRGKKGTYNESRQQLTEVNEQLDMSRPFMGKPKRRKRKRSSTGRTFSGAVGRETKGFCSRKSF
jgi:ssDNA-binding replication factor A large subunit